VTLADEIRRAALAAVVRTAPRQRQGVVSTIAPLTVVLGGDTAAVPCTALAAYTPVAGMTVTVLVNPGAVPLVLGPAAAGSRFLSDDVTTSQTTTSTSFTDLATTGPTVSGVTLAVGEMCLVTVSASISVSTSGPTHAANMGFAVSGATTQAAGSPNVASTHASDSLTITRQCLFTATGAGAHTFTAKYASALVADTATFGNRRLIIQR
jgi:hypothetical protein